MRRWLTVAVSTWLVSSSAALAGGALLYEVGTPDMGLASAGWAARAEDGATVLTNPAGMTRLPQGDLLVGLQALYGDVGFTPDSRTTTAGGDGGNPVGWFPGGGVYWVLPASDRVSFGLAATGNFGSKLDYDDAWAGRYYVQDGTLLGLSVLPALAWKMTDTLSLGLALNATNGILDNKVAVNNVVPSAGDGTLDIHDTVWGFGANLGVLFEPADDTRFGFTYTSPVDLDFEDTPEFSNLGPILSAALGASGLDAARIDLSVTVPETATASFVRVLGDRWTLLGNVGWQDWSSFGKVDVLVGSEDPTSLTADLRFEDTWQVALGAQLLRPERWSFSFGAAYDSSCVEDADRSPTLPLGESWRLGFGARKEIREGLELGLAYTLLWGGTLPLDQERGPLAGRLAGAYEDTAMHFLGVSLRWLRS
ncbi:MAG TPA: outer membrane protein transport protein [Candidatus Polarisedimenticolaceae bacterium]|nr:outer membrane protein transport protein [Candidatus Polarisedimenticolaceae bacterium]